MPAKIKLPENLLACQLTPWEKTELEVVHILLKNTITHALSILTMFDMKFLENAWEFNRGVT